MGDTGGTPVPRGGGGLSGWGEGLREGGEGEVVELGGVGLAGLLGHDRSLLWACGPVGMRACWRRGPRGDGVMIGIGWRVARGCVGREGGLRTDGGFAGEIRNSGVLMCAQLQGKFPLQPLFQTGRPRIGWGRR